MYKFNRLCQSGIIEAEREKMKIKYNADSVRTSKMVLVTFSFFFIAIVSLINANLWRQGRSFRTSGFSVYENSRVTL